MEAPVVSSQVPALVDSTKEDPIIAVQVSKRPSFRFWKVAAVAVVLLLCVGGVAALKNFQLRVPPAPMRDAAPMWLHVSNSGDDLTIAWDRSFLAEARARTAEILITDAGQETARVPLDREPLSRGSITYARRSGNVEIRMRVQAGTDRLLEQGVRFIGPAPSLAEKHDGPAPEPVSVTSIENHLPEGTRSRSVSSTPVNPSGPTRRAFVPAIAKPATPVILLPPSPNLLDTQASLPASPLHLSAPSLPVPALQPPAIATPASTAPVQHRAVSRSPTSGRSIWTGRLPKGGLLLVDGARPSVGALSSPLPQSAATYKVYAADLGDAGIVVYSEGKNGDTIEPPSAANGWNLTTYNADIKRARSVKVLEYPGQQNGWRRLLLRSETRPVSMIVIDWKEIANGPANR